MKDDDFVAKSIKHLKTKFECSFGGLFRGKKPKNDHILGDKKEIYKLLLCKELRKEEVCARLFNATKPKFHQCAHHVNSSQIFCINMFGPLMILDDGYDSLKKLLVEMGVNFRGQITRAQFEYSPCDKVDRTQFDFYAETNKGEKAFFEIKYTERDFGKPSKGSEKKRNNYAAMCSESMYLKRMAKMEKDEICHKFYSHFQVWRIVGRVKNKENDYAVFIFPFENTALYGHFPKDEVDKMPNVLMKNSKEIDELAKSAFGTSSPLAKYYSELKEVYFNF